MSLADEMTPNRLVTIEPLLNSAGVVAIRALCQHFGSYRPAAAMPSPGLTRDPQGAPGVRLIADPYQQTFRAHYAYRGTPAINGIERFLHAPPLLEAARLVSSAELIEPAHVYANFILPGQELGVHTDAPEFRGADRRVLPAWLLVVMHHSGLFETWRLHTVTAVAWFQDLDSGALFCWPDGPNHPPSAHPVRTNRALVFDADTIFHGVGPVAGTTDTSQIDTDTTLEHHSNDIWTLRRSDGTHLANCEWDDLRFSLVWKANCFHDLSERETWVNHSDDLDPDTIIPTLIQDLGRRGRSTTSPKLDSNLTVRMIDEYVPFPIRPR